MAKTGDERVAGATLKERTVGCGWELLAPIDAAEWHRRVGAIIGPAYLAGSDPRAQSGSASTPAEWERARRFLFAAVDRHGTFLYVGCANGHLIWWRGLLEKTGPAARNDVPCPPPRPASP
jgi:hypothetical protein